MRMPLPLPEDHLEPGQTYSSAIAQWRGLLPARQAVSAARNTALLWPITTQEKTQMQTQEAKSLIRWYFIIIQGQVKGRQRFINQVRVWQVQDGRQAAGRKVRTWKTRNKNLITGKNVKHAGTTWQYKTNWQQSNRKCRYECICKNGKHLMGGGVKHKTGETDQGVTCPLTTNPWFFSCSTGQWTRSPEDGQCWFGKTEKRLGQGRAYILQRL
jgi:hypothetical protein